MMIVLVIPDLHIPFQHPNAIAFIKKQIEMFKPNKIIQLGDLVDFYAYSRYSKSPYAMSVIDEVNESKKFIQKLSKLVPEMTVCNGNHEARLQKKAEESGLLDENLTNIETLLSYPEGWKVVDEIEVDGVLYRHGHNGLPGGRTAFSNILATIQRNIVIGHLHSNAGVQYRNNGYASWFCMITGCLIDMECYAAQYARQHRDKSILGCGVVIDGVPFFIPMI